MSCSMCPYGGAGVRLQRTPKDPRFLARRSPDARVRGGLAGPALSRTRAVPPHASVRTHSDCRLAARRRHPHGSERALQPPRRTRRGSDPDSVHRHRHVGRLGGDRGDQVQRLRVRLPVGHRRPGDDPLRRWPEHLDRHGPEGHQTVDGPGHLRGAGDRVVPRRPGATLRDPVVLRAAARGDRLVDRCGRRVLRPPRQRAPPQEAGGPHPGDGVGHQRPDGGHPHHRDDRGAAHPELRSRADRPGDRGGNRHRRRPGMRARVGGDGGCSTASTCRPPGSTPC